MNFAKFGAKARQHCIVHYLFYIILVKKLVDDGLCCCGDVVCFSPRNKVAVLDRQPILQPARCSTALQAVLRPMRMIQTLTGSPRTQVRTLHQMIVLGALAFNFATAIASPTSNEFVVCHQMAAADLDRCLNENPHSNTNDCWARSRRLHQSCYTRVFQSHRRDKTRIKAQAQFEAEMEVRKRKRAEEDSNNLKEEQ